MIKRDEENKQEINIETYPKKKKIEDMEKNRYLNMSEEKKNRLKEYQKHYREVKNSQYNNSKIVF